MHVHEIYTQPAAMTSAGRYAPLLGGLPRDIPDLAAVAQGLLIHEHIAPAYGVTLSDEERSSVHVRPVERLLELIVARDSRPLEIARAPEARLPGNCRHFTVLMVSMLRAQGTPARARCGFGGYFHDTMFEDHWVCEYWHAGQQRWILVDAQIDASQRDWFSIDFDVADVPRDRFLIAGEAWARCRSGAADPDTFGLSIVSEAGDWWIASNLMRDAAALRNIELLPWDCWGAMPRAYEPIDESRCALSTASPRSPSRRTVRLPSCSGCARRAAGYAFRQPCAMPSVTARSLSEVLPQRVVVLAARRGSASRPAAARAAGPDPGCDRGGLRGNYARGPRPPGPVNCRCSRLASNT